MGQRHNLVVGMSIEISIEDCYTFTPYAFINVEYINVVHILVQLGYQIMIVVKKVT